MYITVDRKNIQYEYEYKLRVWHGVQWKQEGWKLAAGAKLRLYSKQTGRALRVLSDGSVDALGEDRDAGGTRACLSPVHNALSTVNSGNCCQCCAAQFLVAARKRNQFVLQNASPSASARFLAIDASKAFAAVPVQATVLVHSSSARSCEASGDGRSHLLPT